MRSYVRDWYHGLAVNGQQRITRTRLGARPACREADRDKPILLMIKIKFIKSHWIVRGEAEAILSLTCTFKFCLIDAKLCCCKAFNGIEAKNRAA